MPHIRLTIGASTKRHKRVKGEGARFEALRAAMAFWRARGMERRTEMHGNAEIESELRAFLSRNFPLYKGNKVDREQSLVESGVIDSMGILELVEFVEGTFDLRIPEEELLPENLDSLANITRYLERKLGAEDVVGNQASSS
jgi:acyl carrier protein